MAILHFKLLKKKNNIGLLKFLKSSNSSFSIKNKNNKIIKKFVLKGVLNWWEENDKINILDKDLIIKYIKNYKYPVISGYFTNYFKKIIKNEDFFIVDGETGKIINEIYYKSKKIRNKIIPSQNLYFLKLINLIKKGKDVSFLGNNESEMFKSINILNFLSSQQPPLKEDFISQIKNEKIEETIKDTKKVYKFKKIKNILIIPETQTPILNLLKNKEIIVTIKPFFYFDGEKNTYQIMNTLEDLILFLDYYHYYFSQNNLYTVFNNDNNFNKIDIEKNLNNLNFNLLHSKEFFNQEIKKIKKVKIYPLNEEDKEYIDILLKWFLKDYYVYKSLYNISDNDILPPILSNKKIKLVLQN